MNTSLGFWSNVGDFREKENLVLMVECETGKPITITVRERESRETVLVMTFPPDCASNIGQALMLASTIKSGEEAEAAHGDGFGSN